MMYDPDYTLRYIQQTPRYIRARQAIRPDAVWADPKFPLSACVVKLPFALDFRVERVFWHSSDMSHRESVVRENRHEIFAVFESADQQGTRLFDILFVGRDLLCAYKKWLYFVDPHGRNLLAAYYTKTPRPQHDMRSYEGGVINYEHGCIFADHPHLRKILPPFPA